MDIESKKWRIRSHNGPKRQLTNQQTGEIRIVTYARDAHHLAAITEDQFDEEMRRAFNKAKN
jgi:hypothetical protein